MLINCSCLAGKDLTLLEKAHIEIENGRIALVGAGYSRTGTDARDCLAIPGLINAHTHIGDSFAKEACTGLRVHEAVGKNGLKWKLYDEAERKDRIAAMRDSAGQMMESGTTCFADFREGGIEGLRDLRDALKGLPIKAVALGRDLGPGFEGCEGLGLNMYQLDQIPAERDGRIVAVHAGEVAGEVEEALRHGPDIIVHYALAEKKDILEAKRRKISVVVCPRSNAALSVGFPPVRQLVSAGVNVALGTDNVMVNSPDMWREMEYVSKTGNLFGERLEPLEVLKMATVNAAKALRLDSGAIEKGRAADIVFVDKKGSGLSYCRDPVAGLVNRCGPGDVASVVIDGSPVFERRHILSR